MIDATTYSVYKAHLLAGVAAARQAHAEGTAPYADVTVLLDEIQALPHPNRLTVAPSAVQVGWVLDVRHPESSTVLKVVEGISRTGTPEYEIHTAGMSVTMTDEHLLTLTVREEVVAA